MIVINDWNLEIDPAYLPAFAKKLSTAGLKLEYQGNRITELTIITLNLTYIGCSSIETVLQEFASRFEDKSYIEFRNDDEDMLWRYAFYQGKFSEVFPEVSVAWSMPWGYEPPNENENLPF